MEPILDRYPWLKRPRIIGLGASILVGLLVFAVVFFVGRGLLDDQPSRWSAQAAIVIFPDDKLDTDLAAGYYSTLSQGQIPNTVAEYFRLPGIRKTAEDRVGANGSVSVEVVEGTSMITITADARKPIVAERLADVVLDEAESRVEKLPITRGYQLDVASRAEGTAERSGIDKTTFLAALLLVAAVAAVAVQQVTFHLATALVGQRIRTERDGYVEDGEGPPRTRRDRDDAAPKTDRDGDEDPNVAAFLELWGSRSESETTSRTPPRTGS